MSEITENQENVQEEEQEEWGEYPYGKEPDKGKHPLGEREQPIGQWWHATPEEQYVETPIGGHVFPKKSREAAGME